MKPSATKSQPSPQSSVLPALLLGCCFPIGATLLDLWSQGLPLRLDTAVAVHMSQPLHWFIDTMAIIFGFIVSRVQARYQMQIRAVARSERLSSAERTAKLTQTIDALKAEVTEQKQAEQELRQHLETAKAELAATLLARPQASETLGPAASSSGNGHIRVPGLQAVPMQPAPTTPPPPSSPDEVFNFAEALARVDGDRELLIEMTDLFLEESPRFLSDIRTAISNKDTQGLTYAAHTLKGSVSNFAAVDAVAAARRLEFMGREGNLAEAEPVLVTLEAALARLHPALLQLKSEDTLPLA